jgi:hypothetical protein
MTKSKYWGISNPPLIKIDENDSSLSLYKPKSEPKTGHSAMFHNGKTCFEFIRVPQQLVRIPCCNGSNIAIGPLAKMSVDEIYCYFNLLCQNKEAWCGINPNYIRYILSLKRGITDTGCNLGAYLFPKEKYGDLLQIDAVLMEKSCMSEDKLQEIMNSLVLQGFLEWQYWIAQYTTYCERRRSIKVSQLKYRYYIDWQRLRSSVPNLMKLVIDIVESDLRFELIAQLRSRLRLNTEFESLCDLNCEFHSLSKYIFGQESRDY